MVAVRGGRDRDGFGDRHVHPLPCAAARVDGAHRARHRHRLRVRGRPGAAGGSRRARRPADRDHAPPMRLVVSGYYGYANAGDEAVLAGMLATFREVDPSLEAVVLSGDPEHTRRTHGVDGDQADRPARRGPRASGRRWPDQRRRQPSPGPHEPEADRLLHRRHAPGPRAGPALRRPCPGPRTDPPARQPLARGGGAARSRPGHAARRRVGRPGARAGRAPADRARPRPGARPQPRRHDGARATSSSPSATGARRMRTSPGCERRCAGWRPTTRSSRCRCRTRPTGSHPSGSSTGSTGATVMPPGADLEAQLAAIGGSVLVIGMRLHALILAAAAHVPALAISYDPKVDAFAAQVGQPVVGRVGEPIDRGRRSSRRLARRSTADPAPYVARVEELRSRLGPDATAALAALRRPRLGRSGGRDAEQARREVANGVEVRHEDVPGRPGPPPRSRSRRRGSARRGGPRRDSHRPLRRRCRRSDRPGCRSRRCPSPRRAAREGPRAGCRRVSFSAIAASTCCWRAARVKSLSPAPSRERA